MNKMKKLALILCVAMMAVGLIACGKTATNESTGIQEDVSVNEVSSNDVSNTEVSNNEVSSNEADQAATTAVTYPLTITDSNGDEVTLEQEPTKIVSMAPNVTEMIFALGAEDKLVGRTDYCDYPEEALAIESVGTLMTPDIEKIISLEPDVVIASTHFSEESEQQLKDLGINVIMLYEEMDMDGVYGMINTLSDVVNKKEAGQAIVTEMQASVDETLAAVAGLESKSVYYVVGFGEYGDYTAGGTTFLGQLLTMAGGSNVAEEVTDWSYTLESLVEADPEIIIIADDMKESFETAETYKDLTAVKNGNVFGVDKNTLERQGYRNAEGLRTLAEIIHPEAFQ